ncbi:MAG TPA: hypothetical protein VIN35_06600, partial [Hydrogenophaga sp.]
RGSKSGGAGGDSITNSRQTCVLRDKCPEIPLMQINSLKKNQISTEAEGVIDEAGKAGGQAFSPPPFLLLDK